jgi:hypothetical protein
MFQSTFFIARRSLNLHAKFFSGQKLPRKGGFHNQIFIAQCQDSPLYQRRIWKELRETSQAEISG